MNLVLRQSSLNTVKECLGQFYYEHIKKIAFEDITWPGTIYGTALHKIIEELILRKIETKESNRTIVKSLSPLLFSSRWDEFVSQAEDEGSTLKYPRYHDEETFFAQRNLWVQKYAVYILTKYFGANPPVRAIPEQRFEKPWPLREGIIFTGTIDLVLEYIDYVLVVDFKTSKYENKFSLVQADRERDYQSQIYTFFYSLISGVKPEKFRYEIQSTIDGSITTEDYPGFQDYSDLQRRINSLLSKLEDESTITLYFTPEKSKCKWCKYGKTCERNIWKS